MKLFYWLRLMPYLELSLSDKYHSDKMAARSREDKWREALEIACSVFKIQSLYDEQEESLKKYFEGNHVYINLPTAYGKSIIYQSVPIVADALRGKSKGTSIIVVISPLRSLMEEQVSYLKVIYLKPYIL